ncbi:MAG TPA: MgtC/SapB family protein [Anaerolineae bacterium]
MMLGQPLTTVDIIARVCAAMVAGFVIGLDRESRGRAAGLRTTMLVCIASALAIVIADAFYAQVSASLGGLSWRPDPTRVAQGILAGMGFLGAGAILRQGTMIRGLTTAAGLWFVTIIGLAFGFGYFLIGGIAVVVALIILFILPYLENRIHVIHYATVSVTLKLEAAATDVICRQIEATGARITRVDLRYDLAQQTKTVQAQLHYRPEQVLNFPQLVIDQVLHLNGVLQAAWETES